MIIDYLQQLDISSLLCLSYIILFGMYAGIRNFIMSVIAVVFREKVLKSSLGSAMQYVWYICIVTFLVLNV